MKTKKGNLESLAFGLAFSAGFKAATARCLKSFPDQCEAHRLFSQLRYYAEKEDWQPLIAQARRGVNEAFKTWGGRL